MTQRQVLKKSFARHVVEPGIAEFECLKCGQMFETDTTPAELWSHLKRAHAVPGDSTYHEGGKR